MDDAGKLTHRLAQGLDRRKQQGRINRLTV
jgi:hypothetical protein